LKYFIRRVFFFNFLISLKQKHLYRIWIKNSKPSPPPAIVKRKTIVELAKKFHYPIFVETGTSMGDTVAYVTDNFEKIYTIEIDTEKAQKAALRFKKNKNIKVVEGDSGAKILELLEETLNQPTIFWLDGHYNNTKESGGSELSPIIQELRSILNKKELEKIILIDDARLFDGKTGYPTIKDIENLVNKIDLQFKLQIDQDIIRLLKK